MYLLRGKNKVPITYKDKIIVFVKLQDADFIKECINNNASIERINFLPADHIICELKGFGDEQ
jgi:hypothetical protein